MKKLKDVIAEHCIVIQKKSSMNTSLGIRLLELPDVEASNYAANLYLAALETINILEQRIWLLEQEKGAKK